MFKTTIAAAAAAIALAPAAALAGPYVNVETNAGWTGDDYTGAVTDFGIGYEGNIGDGGSAWYIQGGPALVSPDGEETETRFSGKVGVSAALSSSVGVYGELSALTADTDLSFDDLNVGGKFGLKYSF